jgi:hypothetical protein
MKKPKLPKEASGRDTARALKNKLIVLHKIERVLTWRIETEEGSENNRDDMKDELEYVISQIKFIHGIFANRRQPQFGGVFG